MTNQRHLKFKDKMFPITELAKKINRRNKFGKYAKSGKLPVTLAIENNEYSMTLICYQDSRNKESILFLTNGYIKNLGRKNCFKYGK